jgi:hypothetical protein
MNCAFALALTALLLAPESLPLTGRLISGPPPQVELKNTSDRAVTAWSFVVISPTQTGTHREVHSADVYLSEVTRGLPQSDAHLDWLRPGQSRAVPVDAAPPGASVQIVAVVLEDGTALGEPDTIASVFAHRAAERDELQKVVDAFNSTLQSKRGAAALEELKQRLNVAGGGEESVPHRSAREAVESWLQKAQAGSEDQVEQSVRTYLAFVTRQHEAAVKHAARKGPA